MDQNNRDASGHFLPGNKWRFQPGNPGGPGGRRLGCGKGGWQAECWKYKWPSEDWELFRDFMLWRRRQERHRERTAKRKGVVGARQEAPRTVRISGMGEDRESVGGFVL
jgi:hypothetical protein